MPRRTANKRKRRSSKLLHSGSFLFKTMFKIFKTAARICRYLIEHAFAEILFWLATLGLGYLLVSLGMSNNLALSVAIFLAVGLLIIAVDLLYKFNRSTSASENNRKGEIRWADSIARFLAHSSSAQWLEYQDWLHDILLARRQLLDTNCPQWKVKLITYRRLSIFCFVVGISKIKQVASKRRSR